MRMNVLQLQEIADVRLGLHAMPARVRWPENAGVVPQANRLLAESVLERFDQERAPRLALEAKQLANGDSVVSDAAVPAIFERTVIREALYRLKAAELVDAGTVPFSATVQLPYSYRDTTAAGRNSTRKYEGQEIARAGVKQAIDEARPIPQKIAFELSDELRHLTATRQINYDAIVENAANAIRIIAEDTDALIFNEILRASDEFGATAVSSENLTPQADGSNTTLILAQWPVVRPRAVYDLQGNQVGSTTNPITVMYNGVEREEYDGTGTQLPGIYYVLDYNLGEIRLVNEIGQTQIPASATAYTISYSYATNVAKFDTDLGTAKTDEHFDKLLYTYGLRKNLIEDERYHRAGFGLMSGAVMTALEQAKQFGANNQRPGTDLSADGDLGRIRGVPNFKTPEQIGLWLDDKRIIIGERGITRYRLAKLWQMSKLENQHGPTGRFTGKKEAYGDQFVVVHTPAPLKRAFTSIVVYSASLRVAR